MGKIRNNKEINRGQFERVSLIMNDALSFIHKKNLYDEFLRYLGDRDEERNES